MANRERARDRGARIGREQLAKLGREARDARVRAGLTQLSVAKSVGVHRSWVGHFERARADGIAFQVVAEILGAVGLDLRAATFPGGDPIRDEGHARLIGRFLALLPDTVGRALEVPFPTEGDPRAWDVRLRFDGGHWGVEAETHVTDLQAMLRRLAMKRRDGHVDGLMVVLAEGRHHRGLVRLHRSLFAGSFPGDARATLSRLRAGVPPTVDTLLLL